MRSTSWGRKVRGHPSCKMYLHKHELPQLTSKAIRWPTTRLSQWQTPYEWARNSCCWMGGEPRRQNSSRGLEIPPSISLHACRNHSLMQLDGGVTHNPTSLEEGFPSQCSTAGSLCGTTCPTRRRTLPKPSEEDSVKHIHIRRTRWKRLSLCGVQ